MSGNEILGWILAYIWSFGIIGLVIYAIKIESDGDKKK
jgi:hypothetical protein